MHWTLADVHDLPWHYYEFLVNELNVEAEKIRE